MIKKILTYLLFSIVCHASATQAEVILLRNTGPVVFATINGSAGLDAETLTGGAVSVDSGGAVHTALIDASGSYTVTVGANRRLDLSAIISLNGLPDLNFRLRSIRALAENEVRTIDLNRASGRINASINVIGGTLERFNVSAFSQAFGTDGIENYSTGQVNTGAGGTGMVLAMPAGPLTEVYASARVVSANGCVVEKEFIKRNIVVQNILLTGNTSPVQYTLNVTGASCDNGSISGNFMLNGLDPVAVLNEHSLVFSGQDSANVALTGFGPYSSGPLVEGSYFIFQTTRFNPPYGLLGFPIGNIDVVGNAVAGYDIIHSVGMAHGMLDISGDWTIAQAVTAEASSVGSLEPTANNPSTNIVAIDSIDPATGEYDFVLTTGSWDFNRFDFAFDSVEAGRTVNNGFSARLLSGAGLGAFTIAEGQQVNIAPIALSTTITPVTFQVEQQSGQSAVTIDQLDVIGSSVTLETPADTILQRADVSHVSLGTQETEFNVSLYGIAGIYQMTASGIGSDGNLYEAVFELGLVPLPDTLPEPLACFAVNKMKVHHHDGKIYINDGAFALPDGEEVDLTQTDVVFEIDGLVYTIPAGSFRRDGDEYKYRSPHGQVPAIKAKLDFSEFKWSLKVRDPLASAIDNSDGVDVSMSFASFLASENIVMKERDNHHHSDHGKHHRKGRHDEGIWLRYKRKPKVRCGSYDDDHESHDDHHGHGHKDDDERKKCDKRNRDHRMHQHR